MIFTDIILYIINTNKLLELIRQFSKVAGRKSIFKNQLYCCTSATVKNIAY